MTHIILFLEQTNVNDYSQIDIRQMKVMAIKQYEKKRLEVDIKAYKILR